MADDSSSLFSRAHSLLTSDAVNPDIQRTTSRSSEAAALAKDVKGEIGTWWSNRKRGPPSASNPAAGFTRKSSSSTGATTLSSPLLPARRRSVSSDATTTSNASGGDFAFPPERAHLHYRDAEARNGRQYPPVTIKGKGFTSLERRHSTGAGMGPQDDDEALRTALEASRKESSAEQNQASKEDAELQRAVDESTALSHASVAKDRLDFERAIRESQEEVARSQQREAALRQAAVAPSPSEPPPPPPRLEDSEWILQARNEKGRLFSEGGAHGWLPPGARRAVPEEQDEQAMLELAMRISLEEEAARKAFEDETRLDPTPPPLPPRRPGMPTKQSSTFSSYRTTASRPPPDGERPSVAARLPPTADRPSRALPPPPPPLKTQSPLTPSSSLASQSTTSSNRDYATSVETSSSGAVHKLLFPPPEPAFGAYHSATGGVSPEEQPYLGSFSPTPSYLRHSGDQQPTSDDSSSLVGSSGHHSSAEDVEEPSSAMSTESTEPQSSSAILSIRNPDRSTAPPTHPNHPYNLFNSTMAGRSMSLISERTERSGSWSTSVAEGSGSSRNDPPVSLPPMARTQSPLEVPEEENESSGHSRRNSYEVEEALNVGPSDALRARLETERQTGRLMTQTREDMSAPPPGTLSPPPSTPPMWFSSGDPLATSSEILRERTPPATPPAVEEMIEPAEEEEAAEEGPRVVFGDGVRFGFPAPCAAEHSCAEDGLHASAPFPTDVVLSTFEEYRSRFAVEARTWVGLLRFLMWFGDTTISASAEDVEEEDSRHCDAGLNLEFRSNDEGDGVLRLTVTLLPPNSSSTPQELTLVSPPTLSSSAKGKGRATPTPSSPFSGVYTLPDHLVLPARLSALAVSLYTLRHLANIALSTQPGKDAAPSYHALRSLGTSITSLAHQDSKDVQRAKTARVDEERLLGKLRDRLRRLKPGGGGVGNGAKLLKAPPQQQMLRTQAVPREERVLASESQSSVDRAEAQRDLRYLPSL